MPDLVASAREVQSRAYAPYSGYRVGAAVETPAGDVFTGCNIENANYANSLHAEEVALATAYVNGHETFERLAVSSARRDGVTPCGMCRQTFAEFCDTDFPILCDHGIETIEYTLGELLPQAITREMLDG